jgi:hypothetical protein
MSKNFTSWRARCEILDIVALEDETFKLLQDVGNKVPINSAQCDRTRNASDILQHRPKILHVIIIIIIISYSSSYYS